MLSSLPDSCDVAIVGAGAAGLATAIFAGRRSPDLRILLLDGAARPGAKILISGGSRCNVTNAVVRETDFWGGRRAIIRRVLRGFPVSETVAFFRDVGVTLHEEDDGKLFPDSNRSRDVLDALLRACGHAGVDLAPRARVPERVSPRRDWRTAEPRLRAGRPPLSAAPSVSAYVGTSLLLVLPLL